MHDWPASRSSASLPPPHPARSTSSARIVSFFMSPMLAPAGALVSTRTVPARRSGQGSVQLPAILDVTHVDRCVGKAKALGKFGKGSCFPFKLNKHGIASVSVLLRVGGPATIRFAVRPKPINPVNGVLFRKRQPHVGKKGLKRTTPFWNHLDSNAAVPVEPVSARILSSLLHRGPNAVGALRWTDALSWSGAVNRLEMTSVWNRFPATARLCCTPRKRNLPANNRRSAVASASPRAALELAAEVFVQDDQHPKPGAGKVKFCSH